MSMHQAEMNPNWTQPQAQRRGCGPLGCLAIGCGGVMLLCCGVGVWAIFYVRSMVITDPAEVAAEADAIVDIEMPDDLKPTMAIRAQFPFYGRLGSGVFYTDGSSGSVFLIAIDPSVAGAQENDIEQVLRESLQQGNSDKEENDFQVESTETRQLTVRGKPATFLVSRGKSAKNGVQLIEVKGTFDGKSGPTVFYFIGDPEKYDEETLTEMIESIK